MVFIIKEIGIDIDHKNQSVLDMYEARMIRISENKSYWNGVSKKRTKHGYHYRIKLSRKVSFWRSIEIRAYCGDDPLRILKDVLRHKAGAKVNDLLFDKKWRGW